LRRPVAELRRVLQVLQRGVQVQLDADAGSAQDCEKVSGGAVALLRGVLGRCDRCRVARGRARAPLRNDFVV